MSLQKEIKFAVDEIKRLNSEEYDESEYQICKILFLSTRPNSHELLFSEDVLKECANTMLGKWIVAEIGGRMFEDKDFLTHTPKESIIGIVPKDQEVEFVRAEDGYLDAYVDGVISKRYANEACSIFERDGGKNVSIEFHYSHPDDDDNTVESFVIRGVTLLGTGIAPSVPNANIEITRFSEEDAQTFFTRVQHNRLTALEKFAEERKQSMTEKKTYKVDKSKDAMSTKDWGSVDKTSLRNKIMEASNRGKLVKDVYMLILDGWETAPSENLKYPVMCFEGDTLVYNAGALASALGYAKKENETSVITKVEKIRKKLGLDDTEGKEEDAKMSKEIEFAAVDIGDMWSKVYSAIHGHDAWRYGIEGIYEEDNKKFAVLKNEDGILYRLDFSLTEEGMEVANELIEVHKEFIETDKVMKFAEPENVEKYRKFEDDDDDDDDDEIEGRKAWGKVIKKVQDHEGKDTYVDSIEDDHIIYTKDDVRYRVNAKIKTDADDKTVDAEIDWDSVKEDKVQKMSAEEMEAEMARLKKDIEDRDNIIMDKDTELAELRAFKKGVEDKEKAMSVEAVMEEIKGFIDEAKFKEFREEGLACEMSEVDGWKNKVKAFCFEANSKSNKMRKREAFFSWSTPIDTASRSTNSLWD